MFADLMTLPADRATMKTLLKEISSLAQSVSFTLVRLEEVSEPEVVAYSTLWQSFLSGTNLEIESRDIQLSSPKMDSENVKKFITRFIPESAPILNVEWINSPEGGEMINTHYHIPQATKKSGRPDRGRHRGSYGGSAGTIDRAASGPRWSSPKKRKFT
jgi:hypothetical protein